MAEIRDKIDRFRDSQTWKTVSDVSTLSGMASLAIVLITVVAAFIARQPLYIVILSGLAASVLVLAFVHLVQAIRERRQRKKSEVTTQDAANVNAVGAAKPNLKFGDMHTGLVHWELEAWRISAGVSGLSYLSYTLPITNDFKADAVVSDIDEFRAQVIYSIGGHKILEHSPAHWVEEVDTTIRIPVGETKVLILAQREFPGIGVWQLGQQPLKLKPRGELKVRILRRVGTGFEHEKTGFFKWYRTAHSIGLVIEPMQPNSS